MKKRLLSSVLALSLALGLFASPVPASELPAEAVQAEVEYAEGAEGVSAETEAEASAAEANASENHETEVSEPTDAESELTTPESSESEINYTDHEGSENADSETADSVIVDAEAADPETPESELDETESLEAEALVVDENDGFENQQVADFVRRLYSVVLGRNPDPVGLCNWYDKLVGHEITGCEAGYGFVFSSEFTKKNLSNSDYVTVLYRTFLNRNPDAAGLKNWVSQLEQGATRRAIFIGVANSTEYNKLCASYGIDAGKATSSNPCDTHTKVVFYVRRCYETFLGRKADSAGLRSWVTKLVEGSISAERAAYGFVFSNEFISKKLSNADYVKTLYQGLFGRSYDTSGYKAWKALLDDGYTRIYVLKGFLQSQEYLNMVRSYGIAAGSDSLSDKVGYDETGSVRAHAWLAIDAKTGSVLIGENEDEVMQLASMTKLMTALLVCEHVKDFSTVIQVTDDAYADITWDTTTAGLKVGAYYTIETLMEGMLVYSGADCANMLACYVGGTKAHFVEMMNAKARALGMTNTNFYDPVGLYDENYSTATQFMKLLRKVYSIDNIIRITAMRNCVVADVDGDYATRLNNTNGLINGVVSHDESLYTVNGLKTGTTGSAGYCLATSSYNKEGNRVLTVVLKSSSYYNRAYDSKLILDTVYKNAAKGYYCLH